VAVNQHLIIYFSVQMGLLIITWGGADFSCTRESDQQLGGRDC